MGWRVLGRPAVPVDGFSVTAATVGPGWPGWPGSMVGLVGLAGLAGLVGYCSAPVVLAGLVGPVRLA
jgi:hypothetical protein